MNVAKPHASQHKKLDLNKMRNVTFGQSVYRAVTHSFSVLNWSMDHCVSGTGLRESDGVSIEPIDNTDLARFLI